MPTQAKNNWRVWLPKWLLPVYLVIAISIVELLKRPGQHLGLVSVLMVGIVPCVFFALFSAHRRRS